MNNNPKYLSLFKDCIIVKGAVNSLFMDLTRESYFEFSTQYYDILKSFETLPYDHVLDNNIENKDHVESLADFLLENEYAQFVENPALFPDINEQYESSQKIHTAIIVFDGSYSYSQLKDCIMSLDQLGCKHIELRLFVDFNKDLLDKTISKYTFNFINSINLITRFDKKLKKKDYWKIIEDFPIISNLFIHSAPLNERNAKSIGYGDIGKRNIIYTVQTINSNNDCGNINADAFFKINLTQYLHNKNCNSCLYKKIAVDEKGNIKNCPSLENTFGNINTSSLNEIISTTEFDQLGSITKDSIKICSDCQFKYLCFDCRAYLQNPDDLYSKPLKCGYDPYSDQWNDWKKMKQNTAAIKYYQL